MEESSNITVKLEDTDEVLIQKFKALDEEYTESFLEILDEDISNSERDKKLDYLDSKLIPNIKTFYEQRGNIYYLQSNEKGICKRAVEKILKYLQSDEKNLYSQICKSILDEAGETPFSFTIAVGAGAFQPQILTPDIELLNKINKYFDYNYIVAIDPHQQEYGSDQTLKNSYRSNDTVFIKKTYSWLAQVLATQVAPSLQRLNDHLFSITIKTANNKQTKIFFMNGWFEDFNFFDFQPVLVKSSYNIFNCSLNSFASCPNILLNKPIYDLFKIVIASMGFKWETENITNIRLKNLIGAWIFYVEKYKASGKTYNDLVDTVLPWILAGKQNGIEYLIKLLSPFSFSRNGETFWSLLGGRRRKVKKTRRVRKMKRNKSRRA